MCSAKQIIDWIYTNLSGRFFFGEVTNGSSMHRRVAFEVHSEASYFALILPEINKFSPR